MKLISRTSLHPLDDGSEPWICEWKEGIMRCTRFARLHYLTDEDNKRLCYDHATEYERLYLEKPEEP